MESARQHPFDPDHPAIGILAAGVAADRLAGAGATAIADAIRAEIADPESPSSAESRLETFSVFGRDKGIWVGTTPSIGFIPADAKAKKSIVEIVPATRLAPDTSLRDVPLKIALDYLRATDYPGSGRHQILFEFKGKHQVAGATEDLQFSQTFAVEEAGAAPVSGHPIFLGLTAGANGVGFHASLTNVGNDDDREFAQLLGSQAMTSGLKLLKTAQPAIAPMTQLAVTVGKMFASRNENIRVQDVFLGLDFEPSPTSVRLALGSYIVVQLPARHTEFDWTEYVLDVDRQRYVMRDRRYQEIPYNFFVFRVSRYRE